MARRTSQQDDVSNMHIETDTDLPTGKVNEEDDVIPVDGKFQNKFGSMQNAYDEGFAAASGVRGETAETDGAVKAPERGDSSIPSRVPELLEEENAGLAD